MTRLSCGVSEREVRLSLAPLGLPSICSSVRLALAT
ncbi:MAG: hypothetical protein JWO19_506 [Bryobacterales bacterium]|nr:hypothetical protein [Bryobacterales bacterium]